MKHFIKLLVSICFSLFASYCLFICLTHTAAKEYVLFYTICAAIFSLTVPAFMFSMWHYIKYQEKKIKQLCDLIEKIEKIISDN